MFAIRYKSYDCMDHNETFVQAYLDTFEKLFKLLDFSAEK